MKSWKSIEESKPQCTHYPGVMERQVKEEREFTDALYDFDRIDYILFGILASIPAGILTVMLVMEFHPAYQETAGTIVREVFEFFRLVATLWKDLSTGGL